MVRLVTPSPFAISPYNRYVTDYNLKDRRKNNDNLNFLFPICLKLLTLEHFNKVKLLQPLIDLREYE